MRSIGFPVAFTLPEKSLNTKCNQSCFTL